MRQSASLGRGKKLHATVPLYLMLLPAVVLVFIFNYIPMLGVVIAFKEFKPWVGVLESPWVGLKNFELFFRYKENVQVIWNTLIISGGKIIFLLLVPVVFSILINEVTGNRFKRSVQTIVYMPHFISWVALSGIFADVLSTNGGLVNRLLGLFGIGPIFFLGNGNWFRATMIITEVWKEFGFSAIIFLSALTAIDPCLYEACAIDGGGRWKQTLHVTLPGLAPTIVVVGVLSLGNVLNAGFDQVFNMINSAVQVQGDIIDTMVYNAAIVNARYGFATALGLFKSLIGFFMISISYFFAYKYADYKVF